MSEQHLSELLERAAARVPVNAPPTSQLVAGADRRRRRRLLLTTASAAVAVVLAVVGTTLLTASGPADETDPPSVAEPTRIVAPAGMRLVAVGQAAIAVPVEWGTNRTRCGTPKRDTVVIDVSSIPLCLTLRPRGVESVELSQGNPRFDFKADDTTQVDGVAAQRQRTSCKGDQADFEVCAGTLYLPSMKVSFRAESSTSAATVDRILQRVRILPDAVGVPGFEDLNARLQGGAGAQYVKTLREAGLAVEMRTRAVRPIDPGYVLAAEPAPGTVMRPGDVVTVTVVAKPKGPADEVRVDINSRNKADEYRGLSDEQIRAGATIRLRVGDEIWAHATGKRAGTLAGKLDGSSLVVDGWKEGPNYPHSWRAVSPGGTRITLTINADGKPVVLGVVTVVVP